MGDTGLSEWEGASDARTRHSFSFCVSDWYTPMANGKITSFNGGGGVIGELSVTSGTFFAISLIDPRLVTRWPKLFVVLNATLIVSKTEIHPSRAGLADPASSVVSRRAEAETRPLLVSFSELGG